MSKHAHEREKLLAESFHGDWTTGRAAEFASRGAAHARRRRSIRNAVTASGAVAALAVALMVSLLPGLPVNRELPSAERTAPAYEIISDDELLVALSERPVLVLAAADGSREVFLLEN